MIVILDYGMGNVASVANMFRKINVDTRLSSDPGEVQSATKLILPGVGAFDSGVTALQHRGLDVALRQAVGRGAHLLGICLGMQLLLDSSDEGVLPGLGLVPGRAIRFDASGAGLRVPHMGWNVVRPVRDSALFSQKDEEQRFYFVHSFHAVCRDARDVAAVTPYGNNFIAAFERGRVIGAQFHPEKSHRFGMTLLKRFSEL